MQQRHRAVAGHIGIAGQRAGALHGVDPAVGLVEAGDERGKRRRIEPLAAAPGAVEQVLGGVEQPFGRTEREDRDRALERVDRAKGAVDRAAIAGIARQRRKILARLCDEFAPFDQELFEQFVHQGRR
jgi:hypothetical protein